MTSTLTLLRGGLVADGEKSSLYRADVLLQDDRIASVGVITPTTEMHVRELPAGSVVLPGFIDMHVHGEPLIVSGGAVLPDLHQGVTTVVLGHDGMSWIGSAPQSAAYLTQYFGAVNGDAPEGGCTVREFAASIREHLIQNVVSLASQGTIRHGVAGDSAAPLDAEETARIQTAVERAMEDGARGISSGLDYIPSRFSDATEMAAFMAPVAAASGTYFSHLRAYGSGLRSGLDEMRTVSALSGVRAHVSHLWADQGTASKALTLLDDWSSPVSFDLYPYTRASSLLAMFLLPAAWQSQGTSATLTHIQKASTEAELEAHIEGNNIDLSAVTLATVPHKREHLAGMTLTDAARSLDERATRLALDLLIEGNLSVGAHIARAGISIADVDFLLKHPDATGGSDGIYVGQSPHPRGWGSFTEICLRYLAADADDGLARAAAALAARPARTLGLRDRGVIAPGRAADLVVLDPAQLAAPATYENPRANAAGVTAVYVNGRCVVDDGAVTGAVPGRHL